MEGTDARRSNGGHSGFDHTLGLPLPLRLALTLTLTLMRGRGGMDQTLGRNMDHWGRE